MVYKRCNLRTVEPFTVHLIQLQQFKHWGHDSAGSQISTEVNLWQQNVTACEFSSYWKKVVHGLFSVCI